MHMLQHAPRGRQLACKLCSSHSRLSGRALFPHYRESLTEKPQTVIHVARLVLLVALLRPLSEGVIPGHRSGMVTPWMS